MSQDTLPHYHVPSDNLMRIDCSTVCQNCVYFLTFLVTDHIPQLDSLLAGHYNNRIAKYILIDCRFDYEFAGGHISGAVNVNTEPALDELLFRRPNELPGPVALGDSLRTVVVLFCEFSAKRAPTV